MYGLLYTTILLYTVLLSIQAPEAPLESLTDPSLVTDRLSAPPSLPTQSNKYEITASSSWMSCMYRPSTIPTTVQWTAFNAF
jgi:hypothetical protein